MKRLQHEPDCQRNVATRGLMQERSGLWVKLVQLSTQLDEAVKAKTAAAVKRIKTAATDVSEHAEIRLS